MSAKEIVEETRNYPILLKFYISFLKDDQTKSMIGLRVIIQEKYKSIILMELPKGHHGVSKSKSFARGYIYLLYVEKDIKD